MKLFFFKVDPYSYASKNLLNENIDYFPKILHKISLYKEISQQRGYPTPHPYGTLQNISNAYPLYYICP